MLMVTRKQRHFFVLVMEQEGYMVRLLLALGIFVFSLQLMSVLVIVKASKMSSNREKLLSLVKWTLVIALLAIGTFVTPFTGNLPWYDEAVCGSASATTTVLTDNIKNHAGWSTALTTSRAMGGEDTIESVAVSEFDVCSTQGTIVVELVANFGGEILFTLLLLVVSLWAFTSTKRASSSSSSSSTSSSS